MPAGRRNPLNTAIIEIHDLVQHFTQGRFFDKKVIHALNGITLSVYSGETLGLVGETGCGKTTLCRAVMRLYKPTGGRIFYKGEDITNLKEKKLKFVRKNMQMIFQDPVDSMNPRLTVGYIVEEPLLIQTKQNASERKHKAQSLLERVGLSADSYHRYPHEFSGGQRQRIAIARSLILNPEILICDEPVSALDVSVQSQVLNLMMELQRDNNLTMLLISHDLSVVRHMSDRVAVLYLGSLMELSSSRSIYQEAKHPYTKALISAIPNTKKEEINSLTGEVPSPINLPSGCPFHENCPHCQEICMQKKPELKLLGKEHYCACHFVETGGTESHS